MRHLIFYRKSSVYLPFSDVLTPQCLVRGTWQLFSLVNIWIPGCIHLYISSGGEEQTIHDMLHSACTAQWRRASMQKYFIYQWTLYIQANRHLLLESWILVYFNILPTLKNGCRAEIDAMCMHTLLQMQLGNLILGLLVLSVPINILLNYINGITSATIKLIKLDQHWQYKPAEISHLISEAKQCQGRMAGYPENIGYLGRSDMVGICDKTCKRGPETHLYLSSHATFGKGKAVSAGILIRFQFDMFSI